MCEMSRRKQSNPKYLKSDMEELTNKITHNDDSQSEKSTSPQILKSDEDAAENLQENISPNSPSNSRQSEESEGTINRDSVDVEELADNLEKSSVFKSGDRQENQASSDSTSESASRPSTTSARPRSSKSCSPPLTKSQELTNSDSRRGNSSGELPFLSISNHLGMKEESKSSSTPALSPSATSSAAVEGINSLSSLSSVINSSLGESLFPSCLSRNLLKASTDANSNQISSMIQGIPLLSSVLPALQRLAPAAVSLPSISSASSSGNGLICVCGVKFSNSANLEAHRMFYCSQRPAAAEIASERKDGSRSPSKEAEEDALGSSLRLLRCPHCTYTTSHKLSLNGHMNIHTNPDDSASTKPSAFSPTIDLRAPERYCSDCDIQFSSMKTFRVHKAHYCQTRHVLKGSKSPVREDVNVAAAHSALSGLVVPTSGSATSPVQPVLALPTNPVLLVPYSLVAGAQLLPPHVLPHLSAAFVLPNGQVHPLPTAGAGSTANPVPPILSPGAVAAAAAAMAESASAAVAAAVVSSSNLPSPLKRETSPSSLPKATQEELKPSIEPSGKRRVESDSPLDLTTKRVKLSIKSDLLSDDEKENRELNGCLLSNSPTPKSIVTGEFEGKLLASPPGVSPASDLEDKTPKKSPESESFETNMTSPGVSNEAPRPSTSNVTSNLTRSPGHSPTGPTAAPLPSLPPGFPNPLVSSLEALGSTLPLASLQCLQSLQNVPRDLALKLINPDLLMNGIPPVISPPVIVKQGEAKCNECNIVFYKEESLQIHKKHYCSARENKTPEDERGCNSTGKRSPAASNSADSSSNSRHSPSRDLSTSSSLATQKENSKVSKTLMQFICSACGIKFSSPDNLAAHQTYYCPKREGSNEEGVTKGLWKCPRCRVVMAETMQAAHQCVSPTPAPSHGWKCPCCPVLSPTAAAAQKHLETHAGIKAFRCTICGYRGNTLRGMRTHIRMHFEKRTSDLQEENFIACILEEDEPRSRNSMSADSRKLLESSRMMLENSSLNAMLAEGALTDRVDPPLSCAYCPFITPLRSTLVHHLAIAHKIGLNAKLAQDLKALLEAKNQVDVSTLPNLESKKENPENGKVELSSPPPAIKLEPEVKLEVQETEEQTSSSPTSKLDFASSSPGASSLTNGSSSKNCVCYCQACNISFSLLDSYVAHKRFYCNRPESSTPPETTVQ